MARKERLPMLAQIMEQWKCQDIKRPNLNGSVEEKCGAAKLWMDIMDAPRALLFLDCYLIKATMNRIISSAPSL